MVRPSMKQYQNQKSVINYEESHGGIWNHQQECQLLILSDIPADLESSAGMSDRMSSCSHSDYAPSSNSGNSSSGAYTDAEL